MAFINRDGADGSRAALLASNPDQPPVPAHDHPDLHGRISALENLFTPDGDADGDGDRGTMIHP